jgi:hypothetical protein
VCGDLEQKGKKREKSMKKKGFGNNEDWKEEREKSKVS